MNFYDFSAKKITGEDISMDDYKGKVVLIVNTASKCGFTPQFKELEELYKTYKEKGLEIIGFPCNQFGNQDPGLNNEIEDFCQINYGVSFTMFEKIDVNGENAHPIYKFLKSQKIEESNDKPIYDKIKDIFKNILGTSIKWNFTKFLIDKNGNVIKRFSPTFNPKNISKDIEILINKQ